MLDCVDFNYEEIKEFPKPFKYTPYNKFDFSIPVRTPLSLKVCKIIILGDLCVGKTSLLNRFCRKVFDSNYRTTIGVDFQTEQLNILGVPYHLQIWDTAGQERFKCIAQCYYRKAHVIMLVFDLSTIRTLAGCKNWLRDALEVSNDIESPFIFLVGSKKDLLSEEAYKNVEDIAEKVAKNLNAEFWSVSSKTGENINDLFFRAAALSFDEHLKSACEKINRNEIHIGSDLICMYLMRFSYSTNLGCCSFQKEP
ncbi:ras-related protein Rab-34 [Asbolus verrucosus]|uniref:Ras-related protein Rab-36 n=1 Tax=Asbolus verrucosus TaxID=1661398 RepID=A0A482VQE4_ASBVE|nr:ras-related protein Rab-34 [Asbolus verrucosus]